MTEEAQTPGSFWLESCCPWIKQMGLILLVFCFVGQTFLVYADPTRAGTLAGDALEGRRIWHRNNCQACHQLYGFGGFLGPDLTNAAARLTDERLHFILTEGVAPMPTFGFSDDEIRKLRAFLVGMDSTGQGQAKQKGVVQASQLVATFTDTVRADLEAQGDEDVERAFALFLARDCMRCHTPFSASSLGPDLSTVLDRLTVAEIHDRLVNGLNVMPASGLDEAQRESILTFFTWLRDNRRSVRERVVEGSARVTFQPLALPWWEFK